MGDGFYDIQNKPFVVSGPPKVSLKFIISTPNSWFKSHIDLQATVRQWRVLREPVMETVRFKSVSRRFSAALNYSGDSPNS